MRTAQVLVARPSSEGTVLAATDFSDSSLPAVEAGAAEARSRQAELTIIHAVDLLSLMVPGSDAVSLRIQGLISATR